MPFFSEKSQKNLETCHPKLIFLANIAIGRFDFSIESGYRGEEEQNRLASAGLSKLMYPNSCHNKTDERGLPESWAFDIAPYPMNWEALQKFERFLKGEDEFSAEGFQLYRRYDHMAGYLRGYAGLANTLLRWGGDWDGDFLMNDQTFNDLGHFELLEG